jgi:hypothetical protein
MPDGCFIWGLDPPPKRVVDEIGKELGDWKLMKVTDEPHNRMKNNKEAKNSDDAVDKDLEYFEHFIS